jgi:hypothetical protein
VLIVVTTVQTRNKTERVAGISIERLFCYWRYKTRIGFFTETLVMLLERNTLWGGGGAGGHNYPKVIAFLLQQHFTGNADTHFFEN